MPKHLKDKRGKWGKSLKFPVGYWVRESDYKALGHLCERLRLDIEDTLRALMAEFPEMPVLEDNGKGEKRSWGLHMTAATHNAIADRAEAAGVSRGDVVAALVRTFRAGTTRPRGKSEIRCVVPGAVVGRSTAKLRESTDFTVDESDKS